MTSCGYHQRLWLPHRGPWLEQDLRHLQVATGRGPQKDQGVVGVSQAPDQTGRDFPEEDERDLLGREERLAPTQDG
jgi:hypothetical protein